MDKKLVIRQIFPRILLHLKEPEITVIVGPRQVGKTTLLFQLKKELIEEMGVSSSSLYYFNLDVVSDQVVFRSQTDFIRFIKNRLPGNKRLYIFVDEVQRIENPGLFFKGVYDLNLPLKLVLTGSSSLEIRSKIIEPLTGRKQLFQLYPLNFTEYISFYEKDLLPFFTKEDKVANQKIAEYLYKFIIFGGYPKVILTEDLAKRIVYLEEIFNSYVEKDVIGFLRIKNSFVFSQFVKILSSEIGNLFNIEKTSQELHLKNQTVKHYLDVLENTFIVHRLLPFFSSVRTEIRKMPKIYFFDTGIRNYALEFRDFSFKSFLERNDKGLLLENFIFSELLKLEQAKMRFWRTKDGAEVDFIIEKKGEIIPAEVKVAKLKSQEISRSFVSFIDRYEPKSGFVINLAYQSIQKVKGTKIYYILPHQLTEIVRRI